MTVCIVTLVAQQSCKACNCLQMIKGDPGMEDIYEWSQKQINVPLRGRTGALLRLSEHQLWLWTLPGVV